jgi:large subunit ribosomal protein L19
MALLATVKDTNFGVGDKIRVVQRIAEADGKFREASFEGMVIKIKGRDNGKTFTVRKIADGNVGVERIFPFGLPSIDRLIVVKRGVEGVKRAKLYFTRHKSPTEIEQIYKKAAIKLAPKAEIKAKKVIVAKATKKVLKSK